MNGHSEDYSEQCEIKENGQVETNGIKIWRLVLTGKDDQITYHSFLYIQDAVLIGSDCMTLILIL